jgi:hypothetical protein
MAVGVVASSSSVLALTVSQHRFGMSVDPLTLRLFLKVRVKCQDCRAQRNVCNPQECQRVY